MKKIGFLVTCSLFVAAAFCQQTLESKSLFDGKLEILVPKGFKNDVDSNLIFTYPLIASIASYHFSNDNKMVNLACLWTERAMDDNGIPGFTDELLTSLNKLKKGIKLRILEDGILLQDGKNIGFVKHTTSKGKWGFHYIFYTSFKDRLLIFEFNCPKQSRLAWEQTIEQIANSLRVKQS